MTRHFHILVMGSAAAVLLIWPATLRGSPSLIDIVESVKEEVARAIVKPITNPIHLPPDVSSNDQVHVGTVSRSAPMNKTDWDNAVDDQIFRTDLDDSNILSVVNVDAQEQGRFADVMGIAIDPVRGKLYWSDGGGVSIEGLNLDGTVTGPPGIKFPIGAIGKSVAVR